MTTQLKKLKLKVAVQAGLLIILNILSLPAIAKSWQEWARNVGPAEKHRAKYISQLQNVENLNSILLQEIGKPNQAYALDVISALNKRELIPELLEKIDLDSSGFLILTINSLINVDQAPRVLAHYKQLLGSKKEISPANIVAMLEPLGRLGEIIEKEDLERLVKHAFPEVRGAVLIYARKMLLFHKNPDFHYLFARAKLDSTHQIRRQIHHYLNEIQTLSPDIRGYLSQNEFFTVSTEVPQFRRDGYDLRIFFGYKDTRPGRFVGDRHERLAFIQNILRPCSKESVTTCGFIRHPKDADLFLKKVERKNRSPIKFSLRLVHSSASTDDDANRTDPFQEFLSNIAESQFMNALFSADLIFYNGHSRFGGGPDFKPAQLNTLGIVDSGFYKKYPLGTQKMIKQLNKRKTLKPHEPAQLIGLFSCDSSQHFSVQLNGSGAHKVLTSTKLMHYSEALNESDLELAKFISYSVREKKGL